jgi:molybdate transport system substrate-binding protein
MSRLRVVVIALVAAAAACGRSASSAGGAGSPRGGDAGVENITVFAASSLTEVFGELGRMLEADTPGTTVTFNFASSSDLAIQIAEGAPADVFASADPVQMKVVLHERLVRDPVRFATNRLVILLPSDNPAGIERPQDLAEPGVKLVLAAPEVPAGNYARQALERLGISREVERNVVSNESDVKAVVTKVALGEADAGVTYVTDVTGDVEAEVRALDFPPEAEVVARYPIAILTDAPHPEGARAFYDLVTSPRGQKVLRSFGFGGP